MKLLTFNANYFLGYNGSIKDYFRLPHRGVVGTITENRRMNSFIRLLEKEQPDFVCLQEIDEGSIRTRTDGQIGVLGKKAAAHGMDYNYVSDNKYGSSAVRHLPIFRKMANGLMYTEGDVMKHHFSSGIKQLFHEIRLENGSIFSVHLPLFRKARKKQLDEILEIARSRENFIIAGDFNVRNEKEFRDFERHGINGLELPHTYPVANPDFQLDDALYSENVDIKDYRAVNEVVSDHKPVVVEFEF